VEHPPYVLLVFPTAGSQSADIGANKVVDVASRLTCLECCDVNGETKRIEVSRAMRWLRSLVLSSRICHHGSVAAAFGVSHLGPQLFTVQRNVGDRTALPDSGRQHRVVDAVPASAGSRTLGIAGVG
jgi:hypothetical protein